MFDERKNAQPFGRNEGEKYTGHRGGVPRGKRGVENTKELVEMGRPLQKKNVLSTAGRRRSRKVFYPALVTETYPVGGGKHFGAKNKQKGETGNSSERGFHQKGGVNHHQVLSTFSKSKGVM